MYTVHFILKQKVLMFEFITDINNCNVKNLSFKNLLPNI